MATWAKGIDFKNSANTARVGGIGAYGSDTATEKIYIGLGTEPWNNNGLQITNSNINFKGNKIYHAGDKPTPADIGAAASNHNHTYDVNNAWLREAGDNAHFKVFGNSRQIAFRTDGTTEYASGVGAYPFAFMYGGDAASNRLMLINSDGDIWCKKANIWLSTALAEKSPTTHTHNYAGSSTPGGAANSALTCTGNSATATTSSYLGANSRMDYGWNGVNYFNISGTAGNAAKANDTPSTAWWHIMRFNHANSTGYYTDLAIPFNDTSLHYKRIASGAVQNGGWVKVLDSLNYNSYAPTKTGGGASGTWAISVSGNAATATALQTARTINGTSFNGSANITTANWGTARTLTIGSTGKSVNGSGNVSWSLSEIGAAASSHNHGLLHDNLTVTLANTTTDSGWSMINSSYSGFLLKSIRVQASTPNWIVNNYGAGVAFGGADTKGVLSVAYNTPLVKFAGGNGTAPVWWIGLTGTSGTTYNLNSFSTTTHNHDSVYVRQYSANGYWGISANGDQSNWVRTTSNGIIPYASGGASSLGTSSWPFNNIYANNIYDNGTLLENKFAASSHTHSYLPLSGGTVNGMLKITHSGIGFAMGDSYHEFYIKKHGEGFDMSSTGNFAPHYKTDFAIYKGAPGSGEGVLKLDSSKNATFFNNATVNSTLYVRGGTIALGQASNASWVGFYDSTGNRRGYVGKGSPSSDDIYIASDTSQYVLSLGHLCPTSTRTYWVGTNSPARQWKGVCCEGGTVGSSDIITKENIERLDGTIVNYNEVTQEISEYQLSHLRSTPRAMGNDYYYFIKDRFKPSYYNYKLSELLNEETGEYIIDPSDEYTMLKNVGFIAQDYDLETDKVAQEFIFKNPDGTLAYNHMSYVTVGMIALQEATRKIESLEKELNELKEYIKNKL